MPTKTPFPPDKCTCLEDNKLSQAVCPVHRTCSTCDGSGVLNDRLNVICSDCNSEPAATGGWEKRFDDTYGVGMTCKQVCIPLDLEHVKSFIRDVERAAREEGYREGRGEGESGEDI